MDNTSLLTMAKYPSFKPLQENEKEFAVEFSNRGTAVAVFAIHGGNIDFGSSEIAKEIAGNDFSEYCFLGLKDKGNKDLHIASERFDEPEAIKLAEVTNTILTVHGCNSSEEIVYVGGLDEPLKEQVVTALNNKDFNATLNTPSRLAGRNPENICNRGKSGKGVQLEISEELRKKMFGQLKTREGRAIKTDLFYAFCDLIRGVLKAFLNAEPG